MRESIKLRGVCCIKRAATWLLPLATLAIFGAPASGQLRNGRIQRELYQPTEAEPPQAEPRARQRAPEIVQASHSAPSQVRSVRTRSRSSDVVTASSVVHASDCGCDSCGSAIYDDGCDGLGCGSVGCDGVSCDVCCGGVSPIAPTCTTICPPGCGPLMALWYRLSVRAETPLYWRRAAAPPALVTTSPVGTPSGTAGELGLSTTTTLLGDSRLNEDLNVGARITLSTWLGSGEQYGLIFRYWNAGDQDDTYRFDSNSHTILARPFFDTSVPGSFQNETQLIAFGDANAAPTLTGNIQVETSSSVDGLELSLQRLLYKDRFTRVDWLYGYQHVSIDESLGISSFSQDTVSGVSIAVSDSFRTENAFNGVSYGITSTRRVARWKMETLFRLGAGNLRRKVNIAGSTTTASGGLTNTTSQGLLARNTNSRPYTDDTFIVVPEVGVNFGYCISPAMDFTVGYNYMHVPKVAQASQQINDNLAVNLTDPISGSLDPALNFDERAYWLHSLGLGLQLRY